MAKLAGRKRVAPLNGPARRLPWSMLRTEWLEVPIGRDAGHTNPTWMAFSESFDVCLRGVSLHVARRVEDRARIDCIVTEVFVENLDVLVSQLGNCEKLDRLLSTAERLIERGARPRQE